MPSPICLINNTSTTNGFNATPGDTITISLASKTGVNSWSLTCIGVDDESNSAAITSALQYVSSEGYYTLALDVGFTRGQAIIMKSQINNGFDINGTYQNSYTTTFEVYAIGTSGYRLIALNEETQGSSYGWIPSINSLITNGISSNITQQFLTSFSSTGKVQCSYIPGIDLTNIRIGGAVEFQSTNAGGDPYIMDNTLNERFVFYAVNGGTVRLPDPTDNANRVITVINTSPTYSFTVATHSGGGSENIVSDLGVSSYLTLYPQKSVTLICDGNVTWYYEASNSY